MKSNQSGFTLIEIAIVLVIIGLLLGGVLKGQELINSAKVKNLATDFRNIPLFIYGYQDKYRALPGDDALVTTHIAGASAAAAASSAVGNGVIEGTWDAGAITGNELHESNLFWQHIRLGGFAAGPTGGGDLRPTNANGGFIGLTNGAASPVSIATATYVVCSGGILGKFAKQLDATMDDGVPNSGSMRAALTSSINAGAIGVAPAASFIDTESYLVCMGL